jgi:predicted 3-demethylubiquinone-9 3-methyltransferase (glyoxalase superfamily)
MPTITTFLGYDNRAEEAANHYVSIFPNSKIVSVTRYGKGAPMPEGTVLTIELELDGQRFVALNGDTYFGKFTDSMSLQISVDTQEEVDRYTDRLIEGGGEEGPCGWVKDRFGVSWQVTPKILTQLIAAPDKAKADRAMQAMMKMKRINIAALKQAAGL